MVRVVITFLLVSPTSRWCALFCGSRVELHQSRGRSRSTLSPRPVCGAGARTKRRLARQWWWWRCWTAWQWVPSSRPRAGWTPTPGSCPGQRPMLRTPPPWGPLPGLGCRARPSPG
uniref:Putative secreted protein n=1 Tax=Ixodes ricinus TaxID=34613 RepID=A0A6B0UM23_IXORI